MLTVVQSEVFSCKCDKCGYEWKSFARPARCAKCKAPGWNKNGASSPEKTPVHNNDVVRENPPAEVSAPIERQSPAKVAKQAKPETSPMRMMFAKDKWKKK
jgi:hypothetical protein